MYTNSYVHIHTYKAAYVYIYLYRLGSCQNKLKLTILSKVLSTYLLIIYLSSNLSSNLFFFTNATSYQKF